MNNKLLEIKNLCVNAENKEILKGINLDINKGEIPHSLSFEIELDNKEVKKRILNF